MNNLSEIAENYLEVGIKKVNMSILKLFVLSILAGMFISFAAVGANTAASMIQNPGISRVLSAAVFPAGLAMVVTAGSELFTGNCLLIMPLLKGKIKLISMVKCLTVVYIGNFLGSVFVAYMCFIGNQYSLFNNFLAVTTVKSAVTKVSMSFESAFVLGILCNFLVCIAVWIGFVGKTVIDKIIGIYFPIMIFVVSGFEHSIANMYYIPAGLFVKQSSLYLNVINEAGINLSNLTWTQFFLNNLIPVTLGNIIGGFLVGFLYWFVFLYSKNRI